MGSRREGTKVSGPELAELFDCEPRTIQMLAKDGILVRADRGEYLLELSVRRYVVHLREKAAGRFGESNKGLFAENALLKREQRRNYELKNAALEGQLIPCEALAPAWGRVLRAVRSAVLAIPGRARFALPHLTIADGEALVLICRDQLEAAALSDDPPRESADASISVLAAE